VSTTRSKRYGRAARRQYVDRHLHRDVPAAVQRQRQELRATIRAAAPEAEEVISYQMPTYRLHGNLVHFAAYPGHIGFYPAPSGIAAFQERLAHYKGAKGSVQFPT
jgi:uncharacterized protein YdhG (YjbR/CyaY superfamily)